MGIPANNIIKIIVLLITICSLILLNSIQSYSAEIEIESSVRNKLSMLEFSAEEIGEFICDKCNPYPSAAKKITVYKISYEKGGNYKITSTIMVNGLSLKSYVRLVPHEKSIVCVGYDNIIQEEPTKKNKGNFYIKVESGGVLLSVELDNYVVKVRKTHNLNGDYNYGLEERKEGSGKFLGESATFYYKHYGYYEIECAGYNKYLKEVFRIKYSNIKHACSITDVTIYADGSQPYIYCP